MRPQTRNVFAKEWVWFDLEGKNAFENTWDLLYDYCDYYGIGSLIEIERSFAQQLLDEVEYSAYSFPMGPKFYLDFGATPKALRGKPEGILHNDRILIDTTTIQQIRGTLDHFVVIMQEAVLDCGPDLIFIHRMIKEMD